MRLTALGFTAMIAAAGCPLPARAEEKLFAEATESDQRLKELHHEAGDLCLRNPSRDVEVVVACKAMIIYGLALNERGWCHGRQDEANAQKDWHICESGSDRFSLDHLTNF
ncbi:hypothetical protein SAMN04244548_01699 [Paracoccus pantotrophus]|nr:hypothetical protein SAMN04244548_01699 [Paracoccus pantotrophus]